ncbi:MAG: sensor histidine kinase [Thermoactinospora sp.]|nr:sensor histidine kinase [Thermoactinospora sp.]
MGEFGKARRATWHMLGLALWMTWGCAIAAFFATPEPVWWRGVLVLIGLIAFSRSYLGILKVLLERAYPARQVAVAGGLAVFIAVVGGFEPFGCGFVLVAWLSVAVVNVSKRTSAIMSAVVGAAWGAMLPFVITFELAPLPVQLVIVIVLLLSVPGSNRVWVWIYTLAIQAEEGKEARARLAVAEERLRFARDLHDLVGHQLSAIAVKTELAVRLTRAGRAEAADELTEVHGLTRKALRELREAVRGYRELDLNAELTSVRSVLEAAGVRCELHLPYRDVPDIAAPVFAYVVREAATNVLKHSQATQCDITVRFTGEEAVLEVRNDGVVRRAAEDLGSGLSGLTERLEAIGGKLTARPAGDEFLLVASVPLG